jgi:hypothetical protein
MDPFLVKGGFIILKVFYNIIVVVDYYCGGLDVFMVVLYSLFIYFIFNINLATLSANLMAVFIPSVSPSASPG